jgi:hypothetical protein
MQVRSLDKTLALQFALAERGKCRSTLGEFRRYLQRWLSHLDTSPRISLMQFLQFIPP